MLKIKDFGPKPLRGPGKVANFASLLGSKPLEPITASHPGDGEADPQSLFGV